MLSKRVTAEQSQENKQSLLRFKLILKAKNKNDRILKKNYFFSNEIKTSSAFHFWILNSSTNEIPRVKRNYNV